MSRRVGVLTMPLSLADDGPSVITKATVDWLAGAGLEVVPIPYTYSPTHVRHLVDSLHGLYLQGGPVFNKRYMSLLKALLEEAHRRFTLFYDGVKEGAYFPIWGTCHGLEAVLSLYGMEWPLDDYNQAGLHRSVLRLMPHAKETGRLVQAVRHFPRTGLFYHEHGMSVERFRANEILRSHFRILTTSRDRDGKRFVSTVEGTLAPLFLTQYHPEIDGQFGWAAEFFARELGRAFAQRGPLAPRGSEWKLGEPLRCPPSPQPLVGADRLCYVFP